MSHDAASAVSAEVPEGSLRGTLNREQPLEGAGRLLGDWFAGAYADDERRGWGIAFPTAEERARYDPGRRMALVHLGELTPERAALQEQVWHTYPPVEVPSAEAVIAALTRPETWPDYASETGRFTPLREGGLLGQTFEIEVAAGTESARPIFTRGYVTITRLGGRAIALYRDVEATAASIDRVRPGDGAGWRDFVAPLLERFDAIRGMMLAGFPPLGGALRLAGRGPLQALRFTALVPDTATRLAGRLFAGSDARAWLYGAAMHGDVPPGSAGSAIAVAYLNLLGHAVGWPSPRGGAQRLTDALVGRLRELGGEIRCGARVTAIHASRRRVTGVMIEGGERVAASIVVADVMPRALLALAGDALPSAYRALLRRYRYGPATVKVDWALDDPIPWQALEARQAGTIHLGGGEPELLAAIAAARQGSPERPCLLLGQQTIADSSRAPVGKHTAWAYTHGPPGLDWTAETPRWVQRMEAHVEHYAPGFRERILARHVLGPADLEARNANPTLNSLSVQRWLGVAHRSTATAPSGP